MLFIVIRHHGYHVFPNFVSRAREFLNLRGLRVFVACWSEAWGTWERWNLWLVSEVETVFLSLKSVLTLPVQCAHCVAMLHTF